MTYAINELTTDARASAYTEWSVDYRQRALNSIVDAGTALGITITNRYRRSILTDDLTLALEGTYEYGTGWRAALQGEFGGTVLNNLEQIGCRLQEAQRPLFYAAAGGLGRQAYWTVDPNQTVSTIQDRLDAVEQALGWFAEWAQTFVTNCINSQTFTEICIDNEYTFDDNGRNLFWDVLY